MQGLAGGWGKNALTHLAIHSDWHLNSAAMAIPGIHIPEEVNETGVEEAGGEVWHICN
jgi:hypothetical protein